MIRYTKQLYLDRILKWIIILAFNYNQVMFVVFPWVCVLAQSFIHVSVLLYSVMRIYMIAFLKINYINEQKTYL